MDKTIIDQLKLLGILEYLVNPTTPGNAIINLMQVRESLRVEGMQGIAVEASEISKDVKELRQRLESADEDLRHYKKVLASERDKVISLTNELEIARGDLDKIRSKVKGWLLLIGMKEDDDIEEAIRSLKKSEAKPRWRKARIAGDRK